MASVQIDEKLFVALYKHFVFGAEIDAKTYIYIKHSLEAKMERMIARKEYAERRGLPKK